MWFEGSDPLEEPDEITGAFMDQGHSYLVGPNGELE